MLPVRLFVTELDPRDMPAGNSPWPVPPDAQGHYELAQVYGQLERPADGSFTQRFHAGIDIVSNTSANVTAIWDGRVYNQPKPQGGVDGRITIDSSLPADNDPFGWTYLHIDPGNNPVTGQKFQKGDVIGPANR